MNGSISSPNLMSGRLLARNTLWNLTGQILPMAVALFAIPILIRGIGVPRFGVLSLAWIVIGYFSLFDFGMGRALTKLVAEKLGTGEEHAIPPLAWTSLLLLTLMGILGGLVMALLSPWLIFRVLHIPGDLRVETLHTFYLLALSLPVVTATSGLRGILEAQQRFGVLTAIRIPMSAFSFAGPLLVLPFSHRLVPVIVVLLIGRLAGCLAHVAACLHAMPVLRRSIVLRRSLVTPLLSFGGWMTLSNIISPIMTYLDRFVIGALLTVTAVAYYTAPFDMVSRLTILPGAIVGVLFPAFAMSFAQDTSRTSMLLNRGVKYIFLSVFPIVLLIVTLAPEGLRLWLGPAFAENGTSVLRWLAAGTFVNCLAQVPFALIQGIGRPDITAKLHMVELPVYLLMLWPLVRYHGIEGAAIAWVARVSLDALLLFAFAHWLLPHKPRLLAWLTAGVLGALVILAIATLPHSLPVRGMLLFVVLLALALASWLRLLDPAERAYLLRSRPTAPLNPEAVPDAH